jgi:hypothetical protein
MIVAIADVQPLWPSELTAWGTLALAVAAVAVALFGEWRAVVRTRQERERSDKQLAEERAAADMRLQRQLDYSTSQLLVERKQAQEREQLLNALAMRVERTFLNPSYTPVTDFISGDLAPERVIVTMINNGMYPVADVSVQFYFRGAQLADAAAFKTGPLDTEIDLTEWSSLRRYSRVLAVGSAVSFVSNVITQDGDDWRRPAVVRWRDPHGQLWEQGNGKVWRVDDKAESPNPG